MTQDTNGPPRRDAVVPADWEDFYAETRISAAVRVGNVLRVTGHTGETSDGVFSRDPSTQVRQSFRNLADTLAAAGATFSDVVELTSYHIGPRTQTEALLRIAAEYLDGPYPAWTAVGVTELFPPDAIIEIGCHAVVPDRERMAWEGSCSAQSAAEHRDPDHHGIRGPVRRDHRCCRHLMEQ
jgi:enamine deaminase RidA (YjgF/YER057c/UK114 family)